MGRLIPKVELGIIGWLAGQSPSGDVMDPELLLCDIGNTSIKLGLASEKRVLASYALPVNTHITPDSAGLDILAIFRHAKAAPKKIKACVISSVVPQLDAIMRAAIGRYIGCATLFVQQDLAVPLENRYERPDEVGADRLVGAYAARKLYPQMSSLIVVDFGTAVTFDCIKGNAYLGGLIFPGPATAAAALASHTAKLPVVDLDIYASEPAPCRDTSTSISHGLLFGFIAVTEGLCQHLKKQLPAPLNIVATGGFAASVARLSSIFNAVIPSLLLDGLRMLYLEEKLAGQFPT